MRNNMYDDFELLKGNETCKPKDTECLKRNFMTEYCKKKGWDTNNLDEEQLFEIQSNKEYKNPGMILG